MTDLADHVDSLRFMVCRPGLFETLYPETTEDMLIQVLMDGMGECHLTGLLLDVTCDDDGGVSPDLSRGQVGMVVLFAGVRFLRAELLNRQTSVVYEAGSTHYEYTQATNLLRDILKALQDQKDAIINGDYGGAGTTAASAFYMADQFLARVCSGRPNLLPGW